jgi:hypothetical protein
MNSVKIFGLEQCELMINGLLQLSAVRSEEKYPNMWVIALGDGLIRSIKIDQYGQVRPCFVALK